MIEDDIKEKKSEDIELLASVRDDSSSSLLIAIDQLNVEMVKEILEHTKIDPNRLADIFGNVCDAVSRASLIDNNPDLSKTEIEENKGEIIKNLLSFEIKLIQSMKATKELHSALTELYLRIIKSHLIILDKYIPDSEMEKFIKDNDLDLSELKNIELSCLLFTSESKIVDKEIPIEGSMQEILLSRTYTSRMEKKEEIINLYDRLFSYPETARIFHFAASQIIKGDSLKIVFTDLSESSYYTKNKNFILIEITSKGLLNTESITAHEFSHFVMEKLYNNKSLPFKASGLPLNTTSLVAYDSKYLEYQKASIELLKLASKFLGVDKIDTILFDSSEECVSYLIKNTLIPLFNLRTHNTNEKMQNLISDLNNNPKVKTIMDSTLINMMTLEHFINKTDVTKLFRGNIEDRVKYVLEECLPLIEEKFAISKDSSFFMERICDIIFRRDSEDRMKEYIVRWPEIAVITKQKDLDNPKIIESFSLLKKYWDDHIIPDMDISIESTKEYREVNIALQNELLGDLTPIIEL